MKIAFSQNWELNSNLSGGEVRMALILVVDDEQDACGMLDRILSALGHEAVTFTDAYDALRWLQHHTPQLIILDFKMQTLDGIQLLKLVRKRDPQARVVILTAYPSPKTAAEAMQLGAAKYLTKPIEIDELEANVEEILK